MANNTYKIKNGINLPPLGTTPTSPTNGDVYYDNVLNKLSGYENGVFVTAGGTATVTNNNLDALSEEFVITSGDKENYLTKTLNKNFIKNTWTASGNMNTARYALAGAGTQNAAVS